MSLDLRMNKREKAPVTKVRAHKEFQKELNNIARERITLGKDKFMLPSSRLTLALTRADSWKLMKQELLSKDIPFDKRRFSMDKQGSVRELMGGMAGLIVFMIVAFTVVVLAALYLQGFSVITSKLIAVPNTNGYNISDYASTTFGNINIGLQQFRWISFALIIGMLIGLFLTNVLMKVHPGFFGVYVIIVFICIGLSIFIQRAYETLYTGNTAISANLQSFVGSSYMLLYLPLWVTVVGFIGGAFLFISMQRNQEQGELG